MKAQKKAGEKAEKTTTVQHQQPSATKVEAATAGGENDDQEIDPNVSLFILCNRKKFLLSLYETIRSTTRCVYIMCIK
jgi:hypothetical protein